VLPHFQGSHNPWMDPLSRSAVLGMTWQTTRGAFLRALLEGMTYELRANIEGLVEAGSEFSVLRNTGGGSRSSAWCQMKADILGLPVETVDLPEAGCLAAAILAGVGTGVYPSFVEPQTHFVHPAARYEPDPSKKSQYDALFATYKQVYPAVSPVTHQL
jgi:xylulokinase